MNWFKNQRTAVKLSLGFGILAALMTFIGYQGIAGISKVNGMLERVYSQEMAAVSGIKDINISVLELGRVSRQSIIDVVDKNAESLSRDDAEYKRVKSELEQRLINAEPHFYTEQGKLLLSEVKKDVSQYSAEVEEVVKRASANDSRTAAELQKKARVTADLTVEAIARTTSFKQARAAEFFNESQLLFASIRNLVIGIIIAGILTAILVGYFISQAIAKPLSRMVATAKELAEGHLNQKVDYEARDEAGILAEAFRTMITGFSASVGETSEVLGRLANRDLTARMSGNAKGDFKKIEQSLNAAAENLEQALQEVRSSSDQVSATAQQLSSASEEISSGAQEQASSLEETSTSLEEITATVKQNADNARQANQLAATARDAAEKGGSVMNSAVRAMSEINTASGRIAEIITTIDEIAFQTNLLALNAAVEAARAGEQGRGFAVVASEVRSLAQRSASAAKEIKGLIQDSLRKVENGSDLVNQSGQTLNEIVSSVKRVTDIVAEISAASQEQATGVEQVAKAMSQMDQVTQANSAQTEEMSSTAEELSATAESLQDLIARFVVSGSQTRFSTGERQRATKRGKASGVKSNGRPPSAANSSLLALAHSTVNGDGFEDF